MSDTIYVAEITVYDPSIEGMRVLRYSTGLGLTTRPTEVPANTYYEPRIAQPALVRRDLFQDGTTAGSSRVGYGDLVLLNGDGALDELLTYGFDGREVVIRQGIAGAAYPSGFETILVGTMAQAEVARSTVTIQVRDRQAELDVPVQTTKYAGGNVLPDGLEGVAADLKAKPKPVCLGVVKNISPACVNTSRLIFQINDSPVASVDAVYDLGLALTPGPDYAAEAELTNDSLAPTAGSFRAYPAGGMFRLGSSPAGSVTADVTEGATSADRTAAQLFTRILLRAGKTEFDWSPPDVLALDTANSAQLGLWISEETTLATAMDLIANSVGAWWGVDRNGIFRIQQFAAPAGLPVMTVTANDLLNPLDRLVTNDDWKGLPVYRCTIRYGRNYTVQTTDLAGAVSDARKAELAAEWRDASHTDLLVQTAHLLSPETKEESLLVLESDTQAEATRRQALRGVRRDRFELLLRLDAETATLDLGEVIELQHPRYELSAGKLFRVLGLEPNARDRTLALSVWG